MIQRITREYMKPLTQPYGLCEAVRHGDTLFVAGQTGIGPDLQIVAGGIGPQARQAFRNIKDVVELAGGRVENLVSLTWYLVDSGQSFIEDATAVVAARNKVLPGIVVGSTAVQVRALTTPEMLVEIQAVCAL